MSCCRISVFNIVTVQAIIKSSSHSEIEDLRTTFQSNPTRPVFDSLKKR